MNSVYSIGEVSLTSDLVQDLRHITADYDVRKVFLVFETNTWNLCWPVLQDFRPIPESNILILQPGEDQKNIAQVMKIWNFLGAAGADRSSLVINVGGGMLTDLGGFAACAFKRGLVFINIPTTLLAMVDASTGGKTGINFRGLKNEIGIIRQPKQVLIHLPFLRTLDRQNLLSGYAEMLKAGLIADRELWNQLVDFDLDGYSEEAMGRLIWRSIEIKKEVVDADPDERGIRKSLNFGHTIGHAIESESLHSGNPIPHGYAVAFGMIAEAYLSQLKLCLPNGSVSEIRDTLFRLFGNPPKTVENSDVLMEWMKFDKKNRDNRINFTLIEQIGRYRIDQLATQEEIVEAIEFLK